MISPKKIIIIGQSSYLAEGIEKYFLNSMVTRLSYTNWCEHKEEIQQADFLINFCIQPEFSKQRLQLPSILDWQLADTIRNTQTKMIFLSSRTVYGAHDEYISHKETDILRPIGFYANNKADTENGLTQLLCDRLAVFRVANVMGPPLYKQENNTFISWVSREIYNGRRVQLYVDRQTVKDFITRSYFQKLLAYFIQHWQGGIWNLGSGIATNLSEILDALVGATNYDDAPGQIKDQFILDMSKLTKATGLTTTKDDVLAQCVQNHALFQEKR